MTTYGQLDNRYDRIRRYQQWLNCDQVVPGVGLVPPPPRTDVSATVQLIRESLPSHPTLHVDVGGDLDSIDRVRAQLTPAENARVQFSHRQDAARI